jgi:nitroreductase
MDFLELASRRHSTRSFSSKEVSLEVINKIIEAGLLTPSACNSQPWKIIAVLDPEKRNEVAKTSQITGINKFVQKAGAIILVTEIKAKLMPGIPVDSQYFAKGDIGALVYGLTLEVESLGLGSCIIGMFDKPKIIEILGLPSDTNIVSYIAVGYSTENSIPKKVRKSKEEGALII